MELGEEARQVERSLERKIAHVKVGERRRERIERVVVSNVQLKGGETGRERGK